MNAAVSAVRTIDEGDPDAIKPPNREAAGVTIRLVQVAAPNAVPMVDVTPSRVPQSRGNDE